MSWGALHWVLEQDIEDGIAKFLLVILAERASPETLDLYRTVPNLARDTSQSERTIQRKLKWLEEQGYIRRVVDFDPTTGRQRANEYAVLAPDSVKRGHKDDSRPRKGRPPARSMGDTQSPSLQSAGVSEGHPGVTDGHREGDTGVTPLKTPTTTIPTNTDSSDPDGSAPGAGAAARDFRKELFGRGVQALRQHTGRPDLRCRTLIGAWLKLVADDAVTVLRAIDEAIEAEVIEPVSWIEARLKRKPTGPQLAAPVAVAERQAEAARMAERGEWPLGGRVFVAADSPEGQAWERYFAGFGQRPKWMSLRDGLGWNMPSATPPAAAGVRAA